VYLRTQMAVGHVLARGRNPKWRCTMGDESTQELELSKWSDHEGHQIEKVKIEDGIFTGYCQKCQRDVRIKGARGEENGNS